MDNKPRIDRNNGEQAHYILAVPESWKRRNLHGSTGVSQGSVESITFVTWICDRQVSSKEIGALPTIEPPAGDLKTIG